MLFSLIMCTHNSAETLEYAILSVLRQTFRDWEMLILDNGSTDGTVGKLQDYEMADRRIKGIYLKKNVGWPKGISICLSQASGEYMMFLGADDLLYSERTLQEVSDEIKMHQKPDAVFTGNAVAIYSNGFFQVQQAYVPKYRTYGGEVAGVDAISERLQMITEVMSDTHYNSAMHYLKIEFMKKWRMDFFSPFYGDGAVMQEVLARANNVVVMDKAEYILTANTSQTAKAIGVGKDFDMQWKIIKEAVPDWRGRYGDARMGFIANRILKNRAAQLEGIMMGEKVRDLYQNEIQMNLAERFLMAEVQISSDAFGEMLFFAGREEDTKRLLGAAGVLYWKAKEIPQMSTRIKNQSLWLADFSDIIMSPESDGTLQWKERFSDQERKKLIGLLASEHNPHHIGAELLARNG